MDHELIREMEHIIGSTDDIEIQRNSFTKVLFYLLSMNFHDTSNYPLIRRFLIKAYEILPSSHLPQQLSRKLGIHISRKRSVSFSSSSFFPLISTNLLSAEGNEQRRRESTGIVPLNNLDISKKYAPKNLIKPGFKNTTKVLSVTESLFVNTYKPVCTISSRKISNPTISVDEILKNPSILRRFS